MEIGGLLNNRQAVADARLRHQLQHGMQLDGHSYGLGHVQNQLNHQIPDFHSMQQQNHNHFSANFNATSQTMKEDVQVDDADFPTPNKPKNDGQEKKFPCGHDLCGKTFARKSDLARHGELPAFPQELRHLTSCRTDSHW